MKRSIYVKCIVLAVAALLALSLVGCQRDWSLTVTDGTITEALTAAEWRALRERFAPDTDLVPLERALYSQGIDLVERVQVGKRDIAWADAYAEAWIDKRGQIILGKETLAADAITAHRPAGVQIQASITDIAATACAALGVPAPALSTGRTLTHTQASQVTLIFLDALGYRRYQSALEEGLIPNLATLTPPLQAITVYPSVTKVASGALFTGAPPQVSGVEDSRQRATDAETIFDLLKAHGLSAKAVEGYNLSFNLRNVDFTLSSDQNGNGSSDDEVLANALAALQENPDLLFVHWHGIDDVGHDVGPNAPLEKAKVQEVDAQVGVLLDRLPPNSLVIIFADHGMHHVSDGDRLGNHGSLLPMDMLIPIWVHRT